MTTKGNGGVPGNTNLSNKVYYDAETTVPAARQTGNIETPFKVLQDAVDACPDGGSVIVIHGSASDDVLFDAGTPFHRTITLRAISEGSPETLEPIGNFVCTGGGHGNINFIGLSVPIIYDVDNIAYRVFGIDSTIGTILNPLGNTRLYCTQIRYKDDGIEHYGAGNIITGTLSVLGYRLSGNITVAGIGQETMLAQCDFGLDTIVQSDAGLLLDDYSIARARSQNVALIGNPLQTHDRPYQRVSLLVPELIGDFAEATVAVDGCEPGDTFDVAPVPPLPATVAIVAAWCESPGFLSLRFFGTSDGAQTLTLDVNTNANTGGDLAPVAVADMFQGAGTAVGTDIAGTSHTLDVPYPGGLISAGDLLAVQAVAYQDGITAPPGWTLKQTTTAGFMVAYWFERDLRAYGDESGTVNFPVVGTDRTMARMYNFRGVTAVAPSPEGQTDTNGSGTVANPGVTPLGPNRLGVLAWQGFATGLTCVPGGTPVGGVWAEVAEQFGAVGASSIFFLELQTVDLTAGGSISGGDTTMSGGNQAICQAFAMVVVPPYA